MDKGIVGAVYFKLNAAYLKNEREVADSFLGMLLDEGKRIPLKDALGPIHYERFQFMWESLGRGQCARFYGNGASTPDIEFLPKPEKTVEEAEFHRRLMAASGKGKLLDCLGIEFWASLVHEVEMDPFGRCDFLIREGRTWHVVEVKIGDAKHDVVAQIDKYRLAAELDMTMGLHDRVTATVIAERFSPYVAMELSRLSVRMATHGGTPESLRLLGA